QPDDVRWEKCLHAVAAKRIGSFANATMIGEERLRPLLCERIQLWHAALELSECLSDCPLSHMCRGLGGGNGREQRKRVRPCEEARTTSPCNGRGLLDEESRGPRPTLRCKLVTQPHERYQRPRGNH